MEDSKHVLRIPFIVEPGHFFRPGRFTIEGLPADLEVREDRQGWHVLSIRGLPTEEAARDLLRRACPALEWVGIETTWGIRVDCDLQALVLREKPSPPESLLPGAHGFANEERPLIFPENRRIGIGLVGSVAVRLDSPLARFVEGLETGMSLPELHERIGNRRMRLAIDVFLGSFFEGSEYAKFLSRITVLEVLKDQQEQSVAVKMLLAGGLRKSMSHEDLARLTDQLPSRFEDASTTSRGSPSDARSHDS
jgi:hypothetical protein